MEIQNEIIQNMKKYDFDVTDNDDKQVDLTKINAEPKDEQFDLRIKNHIVQDNMTENQIVNSVNDLFAPAA